MAITNIISAIGNTSSVYPLILRDCGVEIPSKVYLTYQENKNDKEVAFLATRERIIDEYATSAVWLGGIPLVEKLINKFIIAPKGLNPAVNLKLFKESDCQGIDYNIKFFENKIKNGEIPQKAVKNIQNAINDLKNVKNNKKLYEKLLASKFLAATVIPIALMGFVIPKMVFGLTAKTKAAKKARQVDNQNQTQILQKSSNTSFTSLKSDVFSKMTLKNSNSPSFTGNFSSTVANFSTYQKMAAIDGGYAVGRVVTSRKKNEAVDLSFKMLGMMFLNYVAPKYIEKILDSTANKAFNIDVKLDPLMLADKEFLKQIANGTLKLPEKDDGISLLKFIDENPDELFTKYAAKFEKVTMIFEDKKQMKNAIRDPRAYVDIEELKSFKKSIEEFSKTALTDTVKNADSSLVLNHVEKFAKKAKTVKSINILTNVGLSSFLLAYCLPKVQYIFREWYTGSKLEPGIIDDNDNKNGKAGV